MSTDPSTVGGRLRIEREAAGLSIDDAKELLGHARLTTTEGYVAFDTSTLQPIINDLPVAGG